MTQHCRALTSETISRRRPTRRVFWTYVVTAATVTAHRSTGAGPASRTPASAAPGPRSAHRSSARPPGPPEVHHETTTTRPRGARRSRVRRRPARHGHAHARRCGDRAARARTRPTGATSAACPTTRSTARTPCRPSASRSSSGATARCSADGTSAANFLREIASHGFLVISNGNPGGGGSSNSSWLTQSIDWAVAENSRPGSALYNRLDTSKIGVAGFSCGGLEAYAVSGDPRVTTTGIFSSGLLNDADDYQLRRLDHPIAYIIGGPERHRLPERDGRLGQAPRRACRRSWATSTSVTAGRTVRPTAASSAGRAAVVPVAAQGRHDGRPGLRRLQLRAVRHAVDGPAEEPHARPDPTPTPTPTPPDPDADADADPDPDAHPDPDPDARHLRLQRVVHRVDQWPGGFVANVTVTARSAVNGWAVTLKLPDGATATQSWNAVLTGTRGTVSVDQRGLERSARRGPEHDVRVPGHRHGSGCHDGLRGSLTPAPQARRYAAGSSGPPRLVV